MPLGLRISMKFKVFPHEMMFGFQFTLDLPYLDDTYDSPVLENELTRVCSYSYCCMIVCAFRCEVNVQVSNIQYLHYFWITLGSWWFCFCHWWWWTVSIYFWQRQPISWPIACKFFHGLQIQQLIKSRLCIKFVEIVTNTSKVCQLNILPQDIVAFIRKSVTLWLLKL